MAQFLFFQNQRSALVGNFQKEKRDRNWYDAALLYLLVHFSQTIQWNYFNLKGSIFFKFQFFYFVCHLFFVYEYGYFLKYGKDGELHDEGVVSCSYNFRQYLI